MSIDRSRWDGIAHEVFRRLRDHYTAARIADAEARAEAFTESRFRERCQAKLDAWVRGGGPVPSAHDLAVVVDDAAEEEAVRQDVRSAQAS